jgi:hypothetical protein
MMVHVRDRCVCTSWTGRGVRLEKLRLVLKIRDVMCESLVEVVGVRG